MSLKIKRHKSFTERLVTFFILPILILSFQNCTRFSPAADPSSSLTELSGCNFDESLTANCIRLPTPLVESPVDAEAVIIDDQGKVAFSWEAGDSESDYRITLRKIGTVTTEVLNIPQYKLNKINISAEPDTDYTFVIQKHSKNAIGQEGLSSATEVKFKTQAFRCEEYEGRACNIVNGFGYQDRSCELDVMTPWSACYASSCQPGYIISGNACVLPDGYTKALAKSMIQSIDSRLIGKSSSIAMPLMVDVADRGDAGVFHPNPNQWALDLGSQLTGVHLNAGGWGQSYGLQAITPRHAISCGHNGPGVGNRLRYVNVDGTVFETRILKWINDYNTPQMRADLSVYLLADPLPDWVYKAPIVKFTNEQFMGLHALDVPIVAISQGYDSVRNPMGRKLYVRPIWYKWPMTALRAPFWHDTYVGDSGTPQFAVIKDKLYLFAITLYAGTQSGIQVGNYTDYINQMILRADDSAGISTGYTVQNAPLPSEDAL